MTASRGSDNLGSSELVDSLVPVHIGAGPVSGLETYPAPVADLGEAPQWDPAKNRLHWVDCTGKKLFRLDPAAGTVETFSLPHYPGCFAFGRDGTMIMAYRNKLARLDLKSGQSKTIDTPAVDFARERFNDGVVDRFGRFWIGTMDREQKQPGGALFRLDPDLSLHKMAEGFIVSNGMAFSPDDGLLYHADSRAERIYVYDFDLASGAVARRRVFADFKDDLGRPDGMVIDRSGHLWVALPGSGTVARLAPDGTRVDEIRLPVSRPTSVELAGVDQSSLYITSMRHRLTPEELTVQTYAGALFVTPVAEPGQQRNVFAG